MTGSAPPRALRHARLRAWLSLAGLGAVVLAIPVVLYALGGSPFRHVGYTQAGQMMAATRRTDDLRPAIHWLTWGALLFAWISWAWMTVCVALELKSCLTGRAPARLPASRTMQSMMACLVGTALAVSAVTRVATASERVPAATTLVGGRSEGISSTHSVTSLGQLRVLDDPPPPGGPSHRIEPGGAPVAGLVVDRPSPPATEPARLAPGVDHAPRPEDGGQPQGDGHRTDRHVHGLQVPGRP